MTTCCLVSFSIRLADFLNICFCFRIIQYLTEYVKLFISLPNKRKTLKTVAAEFDIAALWRGRQTEAVQTSSKK
jgi:hypothetical protein